MNDGALGTEHPCDLPKGGFVLIEEVLKLSRQKHVAGDINLLSFEEVTGRRNGFCKCLLRDINRFRSRPCATRKDENRNITGGARHLTRLKINGRESCATLAAVSGRMRDRQSIHLALSRGSLDCLVRRFHGGGIITAK